MVESGRGSQAPLTSSPEKRRDDEDVPDLREPLLGIANEA